jgi:tetratricopeptide (TPR) repeat protein
MKNHFSTLFILIIIQTLFICDSDIVLSQIVNQKSQIVNSVDSLKQVIKIVNHDTIKMRILSEMIEAENDASVWSVYNYEMKSIAEKLLANNPSASVAKSANKTLADALNNIGYNYYNQGHIPEALEYYNKSLNIKDLIGDKNGMAQSYNNIAAIYNNQGDIPKALEYHNKSLNIKELIGDQKGMANSFNNLGSIYYNHGDISKALEYYSKSLKIYEVIDDKWGMAYAFNNLGAIYDKQDDISKALEYYNKGLNIQKMIGDKRGMAYSFNNIGSLYFEKNDIDKAKSFIEKGYKLSKELGYPYNIEKCAGWLKGIYEKQGNYKLAYEYYKEEILMRDSIQNEENYKATQKQQAKYEYEKKAATDSISNAKAMEIKDLQMAKIEQEKKKQQILLFSFLAGFIIILVFSVFLYRLFVQKKMANIVLAQQKEEISAQRDEIESQRDLVTQQKDHIEEIHKEVTDSINYAKRIQKAMLPSLTVIAREGLTEAIYEDKIASPTVRNDEERAVRNDGLGTANNDVKIEYFILFRPKDVVSGDFYWFSQFNNYHIYAVADCTGHGVPGAFMSMLGISFLNEIVRKKEVSKASQVLDQLRSSIIDALKQTGESGTQKDGMDIVLCAINTNDNTLQFAGANNPLWIIRSVIAMEERLKQSVIVSADCFDDARNEVELIEVKPDKQPVAIYEHMTPFTNHIIQLNSGDTLYLMTDGYQDQFGGPKHKKFLSKNLKQLLLDNAQLTMNEQKELLEKTLVDWIGDGEQIDDITILGIKI